MTSRDKICVSAVFDSRYVIINLGLSNESVFPAYVIVIITVIGGEIALSYDDQDALRSNNAAFHGGNDHPRPSDRERRETVTS